MALINCPECKKEISDTAKKCPNCGYKFPTKTKRNIIIIFVSILIAIILGFIIVEIIDDPLYLYTNKEQRQEIRKEIQNLQKSNNEIKESINKRN